MMELLSDREFWVAVAFVIACGIIAWKGWPQIATALDNRAARIKGALDEAASLRDEAQRVLEDYQRKQRDALAEAQAILERAQADAARLTARAEQDLLASLARRETLATDRIARAEIEAVAEVRDAAVAVAIAASREILVRSLDYERGIPLMDTAIRELPQRLATH